MNEKVNAHHKEALALILVFIALSAGIIGGSALYYRNYQTAFRTRVEDQLSAIANLKVNDLEQWRKERFADASIFFQNIAFTGLVKHYFENPGDTEAAERLRNWLDKLAAYEQYNQIFLYNAQGQVRMAVMENPVPAGHHLPKNIAAAIKSGRIIFLDFHRDSSGSPIHLALLVPIYDEKNNNLPLGVLVLRIDPNTYLYPYISRWPVPSATSETLILRREGNEAVFLNDLKFHNNAALNLPIPLTKSNVPSVMAILGRQGIVEGKDYRGEPVIADIRKIPGSPWFLVARTDIAEAYTPLRQRLKQLVMFIGCILIGSGICLVLILRQQKMRYYRERLKAEETLRESEMKFKNIFDYSSIGISITSIEGTVNANPAFCRMLGYTADELTNQKWQDISHPDDSESTHHHINEMMSGKKAFAGFIKRYHKKDGTVVWAQINTVLHRNNNGKPLYFITAIIDTTERKRLEEELQRHTLRLEQKTRDLEQIIYVTSHDLRSPLVNIQGFGRELKKSLDDLAKVLCAGPVSPETILKTGPILTRDIPESLGYIQSGVAQIDKQLSALLKLSRLGRTAIHIEKLDMNRIVPKITESFAYTAREKGIKIEVSDLPSCMADAFQINQIFLNLIDNAIKYIDETRPGVIRISSNIHGNEVVYCVEDNGAGIAPEFQKKIFEIFYRVENDKCPGEGLGLAVVRQCAEKQDGSVWVESEQGKGSRFFVKMPGIQDGGPEVSSR
jgi:PAS domain S-box-containing protein